MADASVDVSVPQPHPRTPPSTAALLPPATPFVFKGPPLTGQLAQSKYTETAAMPVYEMPDYIEHAKRVAADVRRNLWHDIDTWTCPDDPSITVKSALAAMPSKFSKSENPLYFPSVRLLNVLSLAYYSLTHRDVPHLRPIVWHCNPSQIVLGDYLGVQQKPDTASGVGTLARLLQAARAEKIKDLARPDFPWTPTGSVGEAKTKLDALMAQLKAYVANDKRYHVEMATVHGFRMDRAVAERSARKTSALTSTTKDSSGPAVSHAYNMILTSINACGLISSPPNDACSLDAWIAHVVMVYDSDAKRHASLTPVAAETTFTRRDITLSDSRVLSMAPFYVNPPPGRVTFADFVVLLPVDGPSLGAQFHDADTLCFVKFSWQDEARTWRESELLDRLHKKGWFPGVVRHYPSQLSHSVPVICQLGLDDGTSRSFEMLHLGSIGEPLNQCQAPKEILMVVDDVLTTTFDMSEFEDIIHRDLSWFNVFSKPAHDPKLGGTERKLDRQVIAEVLGKGEDLCALVADRDHSAGLEDALNRTGTTWEEKTGTPMFRSPELTCPAQLDFDSTIVTFDELDDSFEELEREHGEYLKSAFPEETHSFAETFRAVVDKERKRRLAVKKHREQPFVLADAPHAPRHDAESMYWVTLWALSRALPRGTADELTGKFDAFCAAMLKEGSAVPGAGNREQYELPQTINKLLHPQLRPLEPMLQQMATYFSIPWQLYPEVGRFHAHIAISRLLLLNLLPIDTDRVTLLDTVLNTKHPRRCNDLLQETRVRSVAALTFAKRGDATSDTVDSPSAIAVAAPAAVKRPLTDDDGDTGSSSNPKATRATKRRVAHTTQPNPAAEADASGVAGDGAASMTQRPLSRIVTSRCTIGTG